MKIKSDCKDGRIRYCEEVDEDGYAYELYVVIGRKRANIIIIDNGVSVQFLSGECVTTNIIPESLFPNEKSLSWEQIARILHVLEDTGMEGKTRSKQEMDELYQQWKELGEP